MTFNARAARAKRPLPLWIDSIIADTQHLEADEFGAYVRILGAMWRRETCDLPLDDRRLAVIGGVSPRLWRSRIGPAVMPFFDGDGGVIWQKRLRREASVVEAFLVKQSRRNAGKTSGFAVAEPQVTQLHDGETDENPDNTLRSLDAAASADHPRDRPRRPPTSSLLPTREDGGGVGSAREETDLLDDVLIAAKVDVSKDASGRWYSTDSHHELGLWIDLGLTTTEIIAEVSSIMAGRSSPPATLKYFRGAMQRAAGRKAAPPLQPITPDQPATGGSHHDGPAPDRSAALHARLRRIAERVGDRR